jgi:hypothetical protein
MLFFVRDEDFPEVESSVIRLGEFSPIGCLFTLGSFMQEYRSSKIFGLLFPM